MQVKGGSPPLMRARRGGGSPSPYDVAGGGGGVPPLRSGTGRTGPGPVVTPRDQAPGYMQVEGGVAPQHKKTGGGGGPPLTRGPGGRGWVPLWGYPPFSALFFRPVQRISVYSDERRQPVSRYRTGSPEVSLKKIHWILYPAACSETRSPSPHDPVFCSLKKRAYPFAGIFSAAI